MTDFFASLQGLDRSIWYAVAICVVLVWLCVMFGLWLDRVEARRDEIRKERDRKLARVVDLSWLAEPRATASTASDSPEAA